MRRILQVLMLASAVATLSASTINGVTSSTGTTSTVSFSSFTAQSNTMGGMLVQVTWNDSTIQTCTWVNATGGCNGTNFQIRETDGSTQTYNGTWQVWNTRTTANTSITSFTLIGTGAGNSGGTVVFDLCWNSGNTPNYTNSGAGTTCGVEGTLDSNVGWSASAYAAGSPSATSVVYTNAIIRLGSGAPVGDEFGRVTFNFAAGNFAGNASTAAGNAFTWRMDSDIVVIPEPATFGLVGLTLLGVGVLRRRKRTS